MKPLVVAVLFAWCSTARADVPEGVAQRLARFVLDGCDYFRANPLNPFKPDPPPRRLAGHFGRIISTQKRGIGVQYTLKTQSFDGWDVAYWERGVDMKLPATVAITMGDLQQYLGSDHDEDVDSAVSAESGSARRELEERVFEPPGHGVCRVFVQVEAAAKGTERRVFSLRFAN